MRHTILIAQKARQLQSEHIQGMQHHGSEQNPPERYSEHSLIQDLSREEFMHVLCSLVDSGMLASKHDHKYRPIQSHQVLHATRNSYGVEEQRETSGGCNLYGDANSCVHSMSIGVVLLATPSTAILKYYYNSRSM